MKNSFEVLRLRALLPTRSTSFITEFSVWQLLAVILFICQLLCVPAGLVNACPAYLYFRTDLEDLKGKRSEISLLSFSKSSGTWNFLPLQVDPLNEGGGVLFQSEKDFMDKEVSLNDRIVFDVDGFADRGDLKKFPCKKSSVYMLINYVDRRKFAYLSICNKDVRSKYAAEKRQKVFYNSDQHFLGSNDYTYFFNPDNYLLFDKVLIRKNNTKEVSSLSSNITIMSDIKNFFTLVFNSDNIESQLESTINGPLGINGSVSFFVRVLFLKLKLSLSTDVSFYRRSAHIPMVLYLPVDATSYLNHGSGIIYNWQLSTDFKNRPTVIQMPRFDKTLFTSLIGKYEDYRKAGLPFCSGRKYCYFSYKVGKENPFIMQFTILKELVRAGFYPVYVADVNQFEKLMNWGLADDLDTSDKISALASQSGFYFSTSGLSEGNHAWDFWMQLGPGGQKTTSCPYPLILRKVK